MPRLEKPADRLTVADPTHCPVWRFLNDDTPRTAGDAEVLKGQIAIAPTERLTQQELITLAVRGDV